MVLTSGLICSYAPNPPAKKAQNPPVLLPISFHTAEHERFSPVAAARIDPFATPAAHHRPSGLAMCERPKMSDVAKGERRRAVAVGRALSGCEPW